MHSHTQRLTHLASLSRHTLNSRRRVSVEVKYTTSVPNHDSNTSDQMVQITTLLQQPHRIKQSRGFYHHRNVCIKN
jgi:hypothetical protein